MSRSDFTDGALPQDSGVLLLGLLSGGLWLLLIKVDRVTSLETVELRGLHTEFNHSLDGLRGRLKVIEDRVTTPEGLWHAVLAEDNVKIRVVLFRPVSLIGFLVKHEVKHDIPIVAQIF